MSEPSIPTRAARAWQRFWYADVDPIRLDALRQGLAFCVLIYIVTWSREAEEWLTPLGFHPSPAADSYMAPQFPLMPPEWLPFAGIFFFGSLAAFIFGIKRSVTTWLVLVGLLYVTYVDQISAFTLNRLFIICFFIFAVAPRPRVKKEGEPEVQIAWPTRMVQVLLVSHYFASALCKMIQGDWLKGNDVLWTQLQGFYMTDFGAWVVRTVPFEGIVAGQWFALLFELFAPLLFCVRRLRPVAFICGAGFHIGVALTMHKLIFFSAQMIVLYLVFVPPEWLRRISERFR